MEKLFLPLPGCSTQEIKLGTSGQRTRTDTVGGGVGKPAATAEIGPCTSPGQHNRAGPESLSVDPEG